MGISLGLGCSTSSWTIVVDSAHKHSSTRVCQLFGPHLSKWVWCRKQSRGGASGGDCARALDLRAWIGGCLPACGWTAGAPAALRNCRPEYRAKARAGLVLLGSRAIEWLTADVVARRGEAGCNAGNRGWVPHHRSEWHRRGEFDLRQECAVSTPARGGPRGSQAVRRSVRIWFEDSCQYFSIAGADSNACCDRCPSSDCGANLGFDAGGFGCTDAVEACS